MTVSVVAEVYDGTSGHSRDFTDLSVTSLGSFVELRRYLAGGWWQRAGEVTKLLPSEARQLAADLLREAEKLDPSR